MFCGKKTHQSAVPIADSDDRFKNDSQRQQMVLFSKNFMNYITSAILKLFMGSSWVNKRTASRALCVVLLCVFTFGVQCCDVLYHFRIKSMFGWSLPSVVCRRAHDHVLFRLFEFFCIKWCPTHIVLFFSLSCVPYVASLSGLSIVYCPFSIL